MRDDWPSTPVLPDQRHVTAACALGELRKRQRDFAVAILVEGKRDKKALLSLGFGEPIVLLNQGKSIDSVLISMVETYGPRHRVDGKATIVVLMDWDRTGGRLQRKCVENLRALDVFIDESAHRTLLRSIKPESTTVEGLQALTGLLRPLMNQVDPLAASEEDFLP